MRRSIALLVVAASAPVLAGASAKAPVPPEIEPKPAPTLDPKVPSKPAPSPFIATARRSLAPAAARYSAGPLSYDVEIVNPQSTELSTHLLVERLGGAASPAKVARVPVNVPPNSRAFVTFADEEGLTDGCNPTYDRLTLETGSSTRMLKITPECTFEMTSGDSSASSSDSRLEQRRGRVHYHSAKLVVSPGASVVRPICGVPIAAQATVRNDGSTTATGVRLRFAGPNGLGPLVPQWGLDLLPGKERIVEIPSSPFAGHPGSYVLRIEANGAPVHQPGWSANVTRSCSLDVSLEG